MNPIMPVYAEVDRYLYGDMRAALATGESEGEYIALALRIFTDLRARHGSNLLPVLMAMLGSGEDLTKHGAN